MGIASLRWARNQKQRLVVLRNQIETAAAPDEPVFVDDWLLVRVLTRFGSQAVRHQVVYLQNGRQIPELRSEVLVVAAAGSPLLSALRAHGYRLTPDASQNAWAAAGRGFHTPGRGVLRIYFAGPDPPAAWDDRAGPEPPR